MAAKNFIKQSKKPKHHTTGTINAEKVVKSEDSLR
jgi:hypothetical protein